jgi:rRNA-processing protein FCF1
MILWMVGRSNRRGIERHKRTAAFTPDDYDRLDQLIGEFQRIVTTPHVLTEISNLIPEHAADLRSWVSQAHELWSQSVTLVEDSCFLPFGLSDAAISSVAAQNFLVLTSDAALCAALQKQGRDVINFNHLRDL